MKKLIAVVIILVAFIVLLVAGAFFYVDLSGHRGFRYDLLIDGKPSGHIKVDRYVTEGKVVYKSSAEYPYSTGYPCINEKLFLKKGTMTLLKFAEEAEGGKGQKRLTLLSHAGEKTDFLFLEHPRFITLKGVETGEKTMVFSPDDIMLYMPIMEKYNFWKKGAQFFEVMIPVDEPVPPMRDKIEVRYLKDEYIPLMGRRMEAESFALKAKALPEAKVFLSKHARGILALEIEKMNMRFVLVSCIEGPEKRIEFVLNKLASLGNLTSVFNPWKTGSRPAGSPPGKAVAPPEEMSVPAKAESRERRGKKEIFFESDNLILSGKLWIPDGEGAFPAVLVVPKDGPMAQGEQYLLDSFGEFLSASGFVVLVFDSPGQGKSQGSFMGLNDGKRIRNIIAGISYLKEHPAVEKGHISLIGHDGGGYLALKAASRVPYVRSCVLLGAPFRSLKTDFVKDSSREKVREHLKSVAQSTEDFSFFMGIKIPLEEYREFIARRPYETILSFDRPLLLIVGRDDKFFDPRAVDGLEKLLGKKGRLNKMIVFRKLGAYLGEMVEHDGSWTFSANRDILGLIGNWIMHSSGYDEDKSQDTQDTIEEGGPEERNSQDREIKI
ncbi:MAG: hypothetical protein DRP85_02215 [Candidatus Makaraimicrobium thalassicum]|nr:MAG: hypothetical protein DRP85_02215 [Candidatus Omnitrophota bacterium]